MRAFSLRRCRLERRARIAGIGDDRHLVVTVELVEQHGQRLLDQGQLVGFVHRTRCVDQEDEIRARAGRALDLVAADADADELAPLRPGAGEDRDIGAERLIGRARRSVAIGEIIDHLLGPHRRRLGQDVAVERGADEGIGGGVDIDREGRDRILTRDLERILGRGGELVAADIVIGGGYGRARARCAARRRGHSPVTPSPCRPSP